MGEVNWSPDFRVDPLKPDGQMESDGKTPSGRQMKPPSGDPDGKMAIGFLFVAIGPDGLEVPRL